MDTTSALAPNYFKQNRSRTLTLSLRMQRDSCVPTCIPRQRIPEAIHRRNLPSKKLGTYRMSDLESNNWTTNLVCLLTVRRKLV